MEEYQIGDHIIMQLLNKEIYTGIVVESCSNRIDIVNVTQYKEHLPLNGVYSFYKQEINMVRKFANNFNLINENSPENICQMSLDDFNNLQTLRINFINITRPDVRYYKAIDEFNNSDEISVAAIGLDASRISRKLQLLIMGTKNKIYLFDLRHKSKDSFPVELRSILESKLNKKIVFNGTRLNDILINSFNIQMENLDDLCMVDLYLRKVIGENCPEKLPTLSSCLKQYLNLVPEIVGDICYSVNTEGDLPHTLKLQATDYVLYLLFLKRKMLNKFQIM